MDTVLILVDSHNGVFSHHSLASRYPLFIEDKGLYSPFENLLSKDGEEKENVFNPSNPDHLDNIYHYADCVGLFVKHDSGKYWRVESNDGNIIAVNPDSEWCDDCEEYHLGVCTNVINERIEEIQKAYIEYCETHDDYGNAFAHLPKEGGWFYHNCQDKLESFLDENKVDRLGLDIDEISDIVLDHFEMVSSEQENEHNEITFDFLEYPLEEIENQISLDDLEIDGLTKERFLEYSKETKEHVIKYEENKDDFLVYHVSDCVWHCSIKLSDLIESIEQRSE